MAVSKRRDDAAALRADWRHAPHLSRLAPTAPDYAEITERHQRALAARTPTYPDPTSGLQVFTAETLAARGWCCDSGCRHCPFVQ